MQNVALKEIKATTDLEKSVFLLAEGKKTDLRPKLPSEGDYPEDGKYKELDDLIKEKLKEIQQSADNKDAVQNFSSLAQKALKGNFNAQDAKLLSQYFKNYTDFLSGKALKASSQARGIAAQAITNANTKAKSVLNTLDQEFKKPVPSPMAILNGFGTFLVVVGGLAGELGKSVFIGI
jgi:hypothetical protein